MNSDRRHELHQNVLETYLSGLLKKIEPHTKLIAVAFASIVGAAVAYGLFQNSKMEAKSDATLELLQNANGADAEALATVGDRYVNTVAGTMARLFEADSNLGSGITALFTDREEGQAKIEDAIKAYKSVITSTKDKLLLSRANFGLARAYESIGETKDAIAAYQSAASTSESDAVVEASKQRIALLEKSETQEFLTWFAKQDFKPADPALPPSFPDGQGLPDLPDLDLPEITPMKVPDELKASSDAGSKPGNESMALPTAGADGETKTAEKTATEAVELAMPPAAGEAPVSTPGIETPPAVAPNAEAPVAPMVEAPATPKAETPETPKVDTPEAPKAETPKVEAPETPKVETPETPKTETPKVESSAAPQGETPALKAEVSPETPSTPSGSETSKAFVGDNSAVRVTDEKK